MTAIIVGLHRPYPVPDAPYCDGLSNPRSVAEAAFVRGWRTRRPAGAGLRRARHASEGHWQFYVGFIIALVIIVGGQIMGWWA